MTFSEKTEHTAGDAGIFTGDHPVIKQAVQIADSAALKAGTILKQSASGGTYEAAEDADTPCAVLIEASDAENALPLAGFHGVAVASRLLGADGSAANDTLTAKLPAVGIYLSQSYEAEVK